MDKSEFDGWWQGEPDKRGRYLVIETTYWHDKLGDWIPGEKGRAGMWYLDGGCRCDATGVAYFRPVPRMPPRPEVKS